MVVAVFAAYIVYRLVRKQIVANTRKQTATLVVAARDLPIGTLIKAADLTSADLAGNAPSGAVLKPETAIGRGVIAPIFAGEPVNEQRMGKAGSGAGLAATIPDGMRACAVKVDEVVGVAGFAQPGMRVDVLIASKIGGPNGSTGARVKTLLQNIEVLSAGKNFQPDFEGKPSEAAVVNLLVTPEQAEVLSLASSNETRIQLVLRNPLDHNIETPPGLELTRLFGDAPKPAPVARAPRPAAVPAVAQALLSKEIAQPPAKRQIQVMNGAKVTEQSFETQGAKQ
jgi:pilus assembly protein CpaB